MGKKILELSFAVFVTAYLISTGVSHAGWWDAKDDTSAKTSTVKRTVTTGGAVVSAEAKKAAGDKIHTALKAKEWAIYLHDRDGGKGIETDTLIFTDETVSSTNLALRGYPESNFGLFVNNDGSSSWETMKTNPATKDKVFLRGELRDGIMTGTVFMKPVKGQTSTFIFSTVNIAPAPVTETTATTTKRGRK